MEFFFRTVDPACTCGVPKLRNENEQTQKINPTAVLTARSKNSLRFWLSCRYPRAQSSNIQRLTIEANFVSNIESLADKEEQKIPAPEQFHRNFKAFVKLWRTAPFVAVLYTLGCCGALGSGWLAWWREHGKGESEKIEFGRAIAQLNDTLRSKSDDLRTERQRAENLDTQLHTFTLFANAQFPNSPTDTRLSLLASYVTNMAAAQIELSKGVKDALQRLEASDRKRKSEFQSEFPFGYVIVTLSTNIILQWGQPIGWSIDWSKVSIEVGEKIKARIPTILTKYGTGLMDNTIIFPRAPGAEFFLAFDPFERSMSRHNTYIATSVQSEQSIAERPTLILGLKLVTVEGLGEVMLVGLRPFSR